MLQYLALVTREVVEVVGSHRFQQRSHPLHRSHSAGKVAGIHGFCWKRRCSLSATLISVLEFDIHTFVVFLEVGLSIGGDGLRSPSSPGWLRIGVGSVLPF